MEEKKKLCKSIKLDEIESEGIKYKPAKEVPPRVELGRKHKGRVVRYRVFFFLQTDPRCQYEVEAKKESAHPSGIIYFQKAYHFSFCY